MLRRVLMMTVAGTAMALASVSAAQVGTAMTYQGRMEKDGQLYTGPAEVRLSVWNAASAGVQLGATQTIATSVAGGLFNVEFDPGLAAYEPNTQAWLQVEVRQNSGQSFTALPRQKLTAAPFSSATRGLFVTGSGVNARVGIGQAAPSGVLLHVSGGTSPLVAASLEGRDSVLLEYREGETVQWAVGKDASDRFVINQGATQVFQIRSAREAALGPRVPQNPRSWSRVLNIDGDAGRESGLLFTAAGTSEYWYVGRTGDSKLTFLGGAGDGNASIVSMPTLEIRGGSDIAEPYDVASAGDVAPAPGMVVSIDPERVGKLRVSSGAYDRMVAGIISGANGVNTGLTLTQKGTTADGERPIAKVGRVWCLVDADHGAVRAGDLLTTSETPGHAMRASDVARSQGAILGKAMSSLESGRGYVLVLVGLQ